MKLDRPLGVRRGLRIATLLAGLAIGAALVAVAYDAIQRRNAVASFEGVLAAARPEEVVDVRSAFPLAWDRVVIVGPYAPGYAANALLGFDHYSDDETFISGDSGQFIIFVRDRTVVADLRNWGPTLFDERIESFGRDAATFVRTDDGFLRPASLE